MQQFNSRISSVKMGSIEFARRHFGADGDEEGTVNGDRLTDNYDNVAGIASIDRAFSAMESSIHRQRVKTEHSYEEEVDLACFPINSHSELI